MMRKKQVAIWSIVCSCIVVYMYRMFSHVRFQKPVQHLFSSKPTTTQPLSDASHMGKWLQLLLQ
ncbi:hypothetical protein [Shouchella lonarensis]|uniref:Uncharacterized protein n=1 Tax=Shouchella lonarensis TaxID=1464122 RepID=A0A1G6IQR6_9BACI|nr:hypothetical protein [Shouchella lonarensis]SDC08849.1 hypothetical protein SAMN05421737_105140 [Shouchella lonarensis]